MRPAGRRVSTVWLGLDHSFGREGPPLIFETMLFERDSWSEEDVARHSTLEEAEAGHRRMVAKALSEGTATQSTEDV